MILYILLQTFNSDSCTPLSLSAIPDFLINLEVLCTILSEPLLSGHILIDKMKTTKKIEKERKGRAMLVYQVHLLSNRDVEQ